jgi:hypothetical protein
LEREWGNLFHSSGYCTVLTWLLWCLKLNLFTHTFFRCLFRIFYMATTLIKKKIKFSSYKRKFRRERLQSQIWLTASSYMVKYLHVSSYIRSPFSYMTLQQIPSEFPYRWGKFRFIFYQWRENLFSYVLLEKEHF